VELFSPPWPWEAIESGVISKNEMSESGTIILEFVDFCHDLPDDFCPVFLGTSGLIMSVCMVDYTLSPII
jgi:hypothetical protein